MKETINLQWSSRAIEQKTALIIWKEKKLVKPSSPFFLWGAGFSSYTSSKQPVKTG
jgi:hypothetical protein